MNYICGIDVGGTFTDCVVIDTDGRITISKSPSTPGDFSKGMFDALAVAGEKLGLTAEEFLPDVEALFHGTTVATNAMVERKGVRAGLITTVGHGDALRIMRGAGRTAGLPPEEYLQVSRASKPDPIIPRRLVGEVHERVDSKGEVVVELDEAFAREVVRDLLAKEVRSIGVSLLWSFRNPVHELRLREIIAEEGGEDVYVTLSHELLPKLGEYERAAGTAINAYIGPLIADYFADLREKADERGIVGPVMVMQASGGLADSRRVVEVALQTIGSGPVAGAVGTARFGLRTGMPNGICTDVGGTTFDVGLIVDGRPVRRASSILSQYEYTLPQVDVRSVGAGGGSIAWLDPVSKALRVGPHSAGADPGPAAYGQGGTEPTVTDANVVLGYIDPDNFLGGEMKLDADRATAAMAKLAEPLGLEPVELAAGIVHIVEAQMAELIRQMTVQSGYDPRDFIVFAYGGAGPTHGVGYASELGAKAVVVPLLDLGAVWSAYGVASSDLVELVERTDIMRQPFDLERLNASLSDATETARRRLVDQGIADAGVEMTLQAHLRYSAQINEVAVPIEGDSVDEREMQRLIESFERRYEQLYGKGSGYSGAGYELVTVSAEARGRLPSQRESSQDHVGGGDGPRRRGSRDIYWHGAGERISSAIYDGAGLAPGHVMEGPAIAELPHTTVVIPPGRAAVIDEFGDCVIDLNGKGDS
jgi:N-methylhydantoinase A